MLKIKLPRPDRMPSQEISGEFPDKHLVGDIIPIDAG